MTKVVAKQGDITKENTDAIVNAANKLLAPGGGVSGAIHRAAGPEFVLECSNLEGCETGKAKVTLGYELPAEYVIHTVGPRYGMEDGHERELLEKCHENSLKKADEKGVKSIAFPVISTGAFGFPAEDAFKIGIGAIEKYLEENPDTSLEKVVLVAFSDKDMEILTRYLDAE